MLNYPFLLWRRGKLVLLICSDNLTIKKKEEGLYRLKVATWIPGKAKKITLHCKIENMNVIQMPFSIATACGNFV